MAEVFAVMSTRVEVFAVMSTRTGLIPIAALATVVVLLSGCGGGGGGGGIATGTPLTILTNTAGSGSLPETRDASVAAPLESGEAVVYDFSTGREITRSPLDSNGRCTVRVSPGLTAVVVVTGTRQGKQYRLSTIIPVTPQAAAEYVADPITSLASEAIGKKYFRTNTVIDQATLDTVMNAASEFAHSNPSADYSVGGGVFGSAAYGQPGCINETAAANVLDAVPDTIDNDLVQAKNAVQQIKEAGVPLSEMLSQERPDIESIVTQAVIDKYAGIGDRIGTLIGPALFGELKVGDDWGISVFDLTPGRVYQATKTMDCIELNDAGAGTAGQIRITMADDGGTCTVTASKSGSTWTVTQRHSADSAQLYRVTIPQPPDEPGSNPSYSVTMSLEDSVFTTPVTFNGTLSATGASSSSYTQIVFNGTLNSPNLSSSGRLEVNFPSSKPAGADPDKTIYDFPSSFTMTNADIRVTGEGKTVRLTGGITASTANVQVDGGVSAWPRHIELNGGYTNSASGLAFEGSITGDWTNPAAGVDQTTAVGTVNVAGELTRSGHPSYYVNFTFNLNGGELTTDIDLQMGPSTLTGQATAALTHDGVSNADLTLTNQSDVEFNLTRSAAGVISGSIMVGESRVADISVEGGLLRIDYTDGTFEAF